MLVKVHKIENFFGSDLEFCTISLLVLLKYSQFQRLEKKPSTLPTLWFRLMGPSTEEGRGERKQRECLCPLNWSVYATTWLVMVDRVHLLLCPSKIFRHENKNTLFLVMVYLALFNNVFKAWMKEVLDNTSSGGAYLRCPV